MKWRQLLDKQRKEKVSLVQKTIKKTKNKADAARQLGVTRQQMTILNKSYGVTDER
tara:strand:- start:190 stop:357 length:168 start_codon:yes stop_codon:yes gene_type:complete